MVTVVVLGAVGLVVGVGAGALVLVALAVSVRAAEAGRRPLSGHGEVDGAVDGVPLVGARHAQFGDATAAARAACAARTAPAEGQGQGSLRLVPPSTDGPDQPQAARAA